MIEIDPRRFVAPPPYRHQLDGVKALSRSRTFALFDEMGSGKSRQVIDAACVLFEAGEVDAVVVVAPASVRSVWVSEEFGQVRRYTWMPSTMIEYHGETRMAWSSAASNGGGILRELPWFVTNYEFLRPVKKDTTRRDGLLELLRPFRSVMLVLDESSMIKSHTTSQYKAVERLRKVARRCVIMNGTPISNNPLDLWAQCEMLDPNILGRAYENFWHYKCSVAELQTSDFKVTTKKGRQKKIQLVTGFRQSELERVQRLIKPYCLRRLKADCLDLPPKIGGIDSPTPLIREVRLRNDTWTRYRRLRREAILALPNREVIPEENAGVKIMRLAQLTSGHVGVRPELTEEEAQQQLFAEPEIEYLSTEKLDDTFTQLTEWSSAEATIVWCRWRPERERLVKLLVDHGVPTFQLYGGMPKREKEAAERAFDPSARGSGRRVLVGQPHAGGKGLQLHAATEVIYQSNDHSLEFRQQSEDRAHRSGTIERVSYTDVLATGPDGQRTIDHIIFRALRAKQDLAAWTCAAWRRELEKE